MLYFLNMHFALGCLKHVGSKELAAAVILLPAHPANFVSGIQSFYFSESQDAIVLQTCDEK